MMIENIPLSTIHYMNYSLDIDNLVEDDDVIFIDDVEEVVSAYDTEYSEEEDAIVEDAMVEDEDAVEEDEDAVFVFKGHELASIYCGSLSKNGKLAITGGQEEKAYVWDTSTGEIVLACLDHKNSVIFSAFNHDESYAATGDMSGIIQVWRLADKVKIWDYNMGDADWMMWHTAANVLLAGSNHGEIYMWKIPDGNCKVFQGHGSRARTATMFLDGKRIAVGYDDGVITVLDLKTSSVLSTISSALGHSSIITAIDCYSDNNLILSAAVDGKTIISTSDTGKIVSILQNFNDVKHVTNDDQLAEGSKENNWVETVAFCRDPTFQVAATGTIRGEIFIWDILKQVLRQTKFQEIGISKLVWKGNTSILFSAGLGGLLACYEGKSGQCLRTFLSHKACIQDLYILENGEKALTTSDDFTAKVFDISSLS